MLDASLKAQLGAYLQRISNPVEIVASLDDTPASASLQDLLKDVAGLVPGEDRRDPRRPAPYADGAKAALGAFDHPIRSPGGGSISQ